MATKKQDAAPAEAGADAGVKVRVLTTCVHGQANDVVIVTKEEADQGQSGGTLDATPEAVAYAESTAA